MFALNGLRCLALIFLADYYLITPDIYDKIINLDINGYARN